MYSRNALGKNTSKISENIVNINKLRSVLSTPFHIDGNTNGVCLCYCCWKNISVFANHTNSIFRLWSILGVQNDSCVSFFVIASKICQLFNVSMRNSETFFILSKTHFSSIKFWSRVDVLSLVAQKLNQSHLVIRVLYKLMPLFHYMVAQNHSVLNTISLTYNTNKKRVKKI